MRANAFLLGALVTEARQKDLKRTSWGLGLERGAVSDGWLFSTQFAKRNSLEISFSAWAAILCQNFEKHAVFLSEGIATIRA